MNPQDYVVGIDLGTSNITLCYGAIKDKTIDVLELSQVLKPGQMHKKSYLPASILIASEQEKKELVLSPWQKKGSPTAFYTIGTAAQKLSLERPHSVVSSAKSWLCHKHVSPEESVLPWGSDLAEKISPARAMELFLEHVKEVFNYEFSEKLGEELSLEEFNVVITVPASFDEAARGYVYKAAQKVGLSKVSLLEEPQAALYSWIATKEKTWRKEVQPGDLVLVCDVGGGTSDFSLVCLGEEDSCLKPERVSVGKHLLLGGDNMDHTLAYFLKQKLAKDKVSLDKWQYLSLVAQVRQAKESLFNQEDLEEVSLAMASKGSSIFAKTKTVKLERKEVEKILLDGFFPQVKSSDLPAERSNMALQDFALEYETETAITKHLAEFLTRSAENIKSSDALKKLFANYEIDLKDSFIKPTAVLFNGGVFKAKALKEKVLDVLKSWGCDTLTELSGEDLDLAVSRGATYFAKTRQSGKGIRIQAGTARSYYLGVESTGIAIPGVAPEIKGLCIVPQGTEEGTQLPPLNKKFALLTGKEAQFRFFCSPSRAGDKVGAEVENAEDVLEELPPMRVKLDAKDEKGGFVPVELNSFVNDVGMLELSMQNIAQKQKWNLEFNVRKVEG